LATIADRVDREVLLAFCSPGEQEQNKSRPRPPGNPLL
jgi:hypothetical protein